MKIILDFGDHKKDFDINPRSQFLEFLRFPCNVETQALGSVSSMALIFQKTEKIENHKRVYQFIGFDELASMPTMPEFDRMLTYRHGNRVQFGDEIINLIDR